VYEPAGNGGDCIYSHSSLPTALPSSRLPPSLSPLLSLLCRAEVELVVVAVAAERWCGAVLVFVVRDANAGPNLGRSKLLFHNLFPIYNYTKYVLHVRRVSNVSTQCVEHPDIQMSVYICACVVACRCEKEKSGSTRRSQDVGVSTGGAFVTKPLGIPQSVGAWVTSSREKRKEEKEKEEKKRGKKEKEEKKRGKKRGKKKKKKKREEKKEEKKKKKGKIIGRNFLRHVYVHKYFIYILPT